MSFDWKKSVWVAKLDGLGIYTLEISWLFRYTVTLPLLTKG